MAAEVLSDFSFRPGERPEIRVGDARVVNYSDMPVEKVISLFPKSLRADKIVTMPDLNPGRAPLPSGCSVEINVMNQLDWRKFLLSDIGCGMQVLSSSLKWEDFEQDLNVWDNLYPKLRANKGKLGDLGSGNHFLDAAVDDEGRVYFIVHTGSRNHSAKVDTYLDQPRKFDAIYKETQEWARANRDTVAQMLGRTYPDLELMFDQPHNSFAKKDHSVVIYKGTVSLQPGNLSLIPSSMDGDMVIVEGVEQNLAPINHTIAHGTGRIKSRGDSKEDAQLYDFDSLRKRVHIPDEIPDASILTENPSCYRDLDHSLKSIRELIVVKKRLTPVAYIGQI